MRTIAFALCLMLGNIGVVMASAVPPTPGVTDVWKNAFTSYCKTATQMACQYYREHATYCLNDALAAPSIYRYLLILKRQGLSSSQAVQMTVEGSNSNPYRIAPSDIGTIATAAARVIDGLTRRNQVKAQQGLKLVSLTDPSTTDGFAREVVLRACLNNIDQ